jgi:hypothetical protein
MATRILDAMPHVRSSRAAFDDVRAFCLFIGYPRSGHSLVGSLIDAHPCAVISHELDALRYVGTRLVPRDLLYTMILRRDRAFASAGRTWTGYDYEVPGQAQGRFDRLRVIGDKRGGGTTKRLGRRPELLARLRRLVGVDVRMVHVIRDPFDAIASMQRRTREPLEATITRFFDACATNAAVRDAHPGAVVDVRLERLVADPAAVMRRVTGFLDLDAPASYLEGCAAVVFDAPRRAREAIAWPAAQVADVTRRIEAYPFLDGYAFDA